MKTNKAQINESFSYDDDEAYGNEYGYNARRGYYRNIDISDNYDEPLYAWGDHMIMNYDPDFHRPLKKREQKKFELRKKAITPRMEKIKQAWEILSHQRASMPQNYIESNALTQEVAQVCNLLVDVEMKVLADEIWAALLSKDAHKLVNALNYVQQELMNGGASQSPVYQETRKLYLKCKDMLINQNYIKESNDMKTIKENSKKKRINLSEHHVGTINLHFIETDYNGRHYYYDDNKEQYVGMGGSPENPQYLYTAYGRDWEPDSEVECDNINVLSESKKKVAIKESQLKTIITQSINEALNDYIESEEDIRKRELMKDLNSVRWGKLGTGNPSIEKAARQVAKKWGLTVKECKTIFFESQYTGYDKTSQSLIDKAIRNRSHSLWGGSHKSNPMEWMDKFAGSPEAKQMARQLNPSGGLPNLKKSLGIKESKSAPIKLTESQLRDIIGKAVRETLHR